ncbi:MAG: Fur family transcriptional regulator [Armatimonadota bacterium]
MKKLQSTSTSSRSTRQRSIILEELRAVTSHPTADDLYEMVRKRLPRISLGTIYRNLDLLCAQGEIVRIDTGQQRRFDATVEEHQHIRCVECGRVADVRLNQTPLPLLEVAALTQYKVLRQRVNFDGVCPECCGHRDEREVAQA